MPKNRLDTFGNHSVANVYDEVTLPSGSLAFNGINTQSLIVPVSAGNFGANSFTIELWAQFTTNQGGYKPLLCQYNAADQTGWVFVTETNNYLYAYFTTTSGSWTVTLSTTFTPVPFKWHHLVITRDLTQTTQLRMFVDGALVGSTTYAGTQMTSTTNGAIGYYAYFPGGARTFNGNISNVRYINGSVPSNYQTSTTTVGTQVFTPPTLPLEAVANTSLLLKSTSLSSYITDSSPNNHSLLNNNGVAFNNQSPFNGVSTNFGSISFNGSNQYLSIASNAAYNMSSGNYTIEMWVYQHARAAGAAVLFSLRNADDSTAPDLCINSNGTLQFYNVSGALGSASSGSVALNVWTHVAAVRISGTVYYYINGIACGSTTQSTTWSGTTPKIGGQGWNASYLLNGYISTVRYATTAIYNAAFTPPTNPSLTAVSGTQILLSMNNSASYLTDSSTNAATVTNNNAATFVSQLALNSYPCGSLQYNGSSQYLTATNTTFAFTSSNWTVEAWVYLNAMPTSDAWPTNWSQHMVVAGVGTFNLGDGMDCIIGQTKLMIQSNDTQYAGTAHGMTVGNWYHLAYVRNGNTIYFYVNGINKGSAAFSGSIGTGASTYIGCETGQGAFLNGYMTNLRVVNGTAVYTSDFTPPTRILSAIANTTLLLNTTTMPTYITDSSTNAYTITNNGGTPFKQFAPFTSLRQRVTNDGSILFNSGIDEVTLPTGSLSFDGSSQYLSGSTSSAFNMGSGDFTVECWVYWNGTSTYYQNIVGSNTASFSGNATFFRVWGTAAPPTTLRNKIGIGNPTHDGVSSVYSTNDLTVNAWNHIAATRSGGIIRVFINGNLEGTGTSDTSTYDFGDNGICIARAPWDGANGWYSGYISNVRLIKGTALYTKSFTPPTQPLENITNTSLLLKSSTLANAITDSSTNAFTITNNNNVAFNYQSPFNDRPCGSILFSGSGQYLTTQATSALEFGSNNFTIEFWWYPTSTSRQALYHGSFGTDWSIGIDYSSVSTNQKIGIWASSNGTSWNLINADAGGNGIGTISITQNAWNHIAYVRSGTTWSLYINGVRDLNLTGISGSIVNRSGSSKAIGAWWSAGVSPAPCSGNITNFRIVNGTALYTANFTPSQTVLQAVTNTALLLQVANSSTLAIDSSTNALTITNNGTAVYRQFAPITNAKQRLDTAGTHYINGVYDEVTLPAGSSYFNGVNNYITTTTLPSLNGGNFTLEAWINPGTSVAEGPVFKAYQSGTNNYEIRLVNNVLSAYFNSGAAVIGGSTLANNTWYHVALVRNGSTLTQYLNGVANGSVTVTTNTTVSTAYIGRQQTSTFWNGSISNLRLVNNAIYTSNFTPPTKPFESNANTIFLLKGANSSTLATDSSSNPIAFTYNGPTLFNYQSPFNDQPCGSLSFNGSSQYLTLSGSPVPATGQFTIEGWVYTSTSAVQIIYSQYLNTNANRMHFTIDNYTGYKLTFAHGTAATVVGNTVVPLNQWNHVAVTRDASNTLRLFLNGVLDGAQTSYTSSLGQDNPRVSGFNGTGTYNFNGYMTNIRVSNTALYTGNFTLPTTVLQSATDTRFLLKVANSANFITDSGPNAYTVTNNGTVLYKQFAPLAN